MLSARRIQEPVAPQLPARFTTLIPRKTPYEWCKAGETPVVVDVLQPAVQLFEISSPRLMRLLGYLPADVVSFCAKACLA